MSAFRVLIFIVCLLLPFSASAQSNNGAFVGIFGQGLWSSLDVEEAATNAKTWNNTNWMAYSGNIDGIGAGAVVGYDVNVSGPFFVGIDVSAAVGNWDVNYSINGAWNAVGFYEIDSELMLRLRLGYKISSAASVYVAGGYARLKGRHGGGTGGNTCLTKTCIAVVANNNASSTGFDADGWTIAGGAEFNLGGPVFFAEVSYTDYETVNFVLHGNNHKVDIENTSVRLGVKVPIGSP